MIHVLFFYTITLYNNTVGIFQLQNKKKKTGSSSLLMTLKRTRFAQVLFWHLCLHYLRSSFLYFRIIQTSVKFCILFCSEQEQICGCRFGEKIQTYINIENMQDIGIRFFAFRLWMFVCYCIFTNMCADQSLQSIAPIPNVQGHIAFSVVA